MSFRVLSIAVAGEALAAPPAVGAAAPADTVLRNGFVYTVDAQNPTARAIAIRNGRIVFVGSSRGARAYVGKRTEVLDLRGRMAMPGLVDGHAHPLGGGDILDNCNLGNVEATIAELQRLIRACDRGDPATDDQDWLEVSNWNPTGVLPSGTVVSRRDLDAVSATRPIFIQGSDFHNAWVNTRALELAGVTKDTPNPPDGEIVREPDGTPGGLLKDGATGLVSRAIPEKTPAENLADARRAQRALNDAGITTVMDAASGATSLSAFGTLARRHQLTVRLSSFVPVEADMAPRKAFAYVRNLRRRFSVPGSTVGGVKLFLDGVIEYPAQTAALLKPYLVKRNGKWVPGPNRGESYFSRKQAGDLVTLFDAKGWRVHMHTIGDRAVRIGLDAAAAARRANHSTSRRNIALTHLELVHPRDYVRFRKLGVFANMQLQWAVRNSFTVEALAPYIGPKRMRLLYPARSLIEAGAPFAQGSDWPVDPLNPWLELEVAHTRSDGSGGPLNRAEAISLPRAVRAHTLGSARQLGLAGRVGSLEVGKSADVIVVDRNILRVKPRQVHKTRVLRTLLRGRTVYRATRTGEALVRLARGNRVVSTAAPTASPRWSVACAVSVLGLKGVA